MNAGEGTGPATRPPGETAKRRRVLMVCYAFPPIGGPGVQRSLYFAKYLPEFGWDPVVLHALDTGIFRVRDESLLRELPPGVTRVPIAPSDPGAWAEDLIASVNGWLPRSWAAGMEWRIRSAASRVGAWMVPDERFLWGLRALKRARQLVRRLGVSVVYSTADPYINPYVGWRLRRETRLPWVADFRDLWTQDYGYRPASALRTFADPRYERRFLRDADAIVTVTEHYTRVMHSLAPARAASAFMTIRNGFDGIRPTATPETAGHSTGEFILRYIGSLYESRAGAAIADAVMRCNETPGAPPVRLEIIGFVERACAERYQRLLGPRLCVLGYQPHDKARELTNTADALLLTVNRGRNWEGIVPGKLYELLASGRPILCLTPGEGETARLVLQHNAGLTANIDSADEIHDALATMRDAWQRGEKRWGAAPAELTCYDRRELTRRLAGVFDSLVRERGRGTA